jgi:hypoxanthine phosphoribosyltransferase
MRQKKILLRDEQIQARMKALAQQIADDYAGKSITIIAVLSGGMLVAADLIRYLWQLDFEDTQLDTIKISSYGQAVVTSGQPKLVRDIHLDITGHHVLVVEDLVDTGLTLNLLMEHLRGKQPASVETLCFLSKPAEIREVAVSVKYLGFEIPNVWVEGYGIDTAETGRGNPNIMEVIP